MTEERTFCMYQCEKCNRKDCPLIEEDSEVDMDKDRSLSRLRHHAQTKERTQSKEIKSYTAAQKVVKDKKKERKEKREERRKEKQN